MLGGDEMEHAAEDSPDGMTLRKVIEDDIVKKDIKNHSFRNPLHHHLRRIVPPSISRSSKST